MELRQTNVFTKRGANQKDITFTFVILAPVRLPISNRDRDRDRFFKKSYSAQILRFSFASKQCNVSFNADFYGNIGNFWRSALQ